MSDPKSTVLTDSVKRNFTAVDLFSGCGGLTSGLKAAGFNILAAVEKDQDAAATYKANHPSVRLYDSDIREVSPKSLLNDLELPRGTTIDLLAGCPPCQGFTRLTQGKGRRDRRNSLIREFLRYARAIRPKTCMLENVPGLLTTAKGKRYFNELRRGLESAGYEITYGVVELADYGIPQFRKRLVVLAALGREISIPSPSHGDPTKETESKRRQWRTVRDAIAQLPSPPLRSEVRTGAASAPYPWHYARDVAPAVRERLEHALRNGGGRTALPDRLRLPCHERTPDGYFDVYGVVDWDRPSPTITSGCTNASKGRFGHPDAPRPLTALEAALLQTFPRSYRFQGSGLESVASQIGNALPQKFARIVGRAIVRHLRNRASARDV